MSQMQMFGGMGNVDPSTLNLNTNAISNNGMNFNDYGNPNMANMLNMGFYPIYHNVNGPNPNNQFNFGIKLNNIYL